MKKKLSAFMALLFVLSTIFSVNVFAASNIKINGVDIGYAAGQYFSKNGKACTCHNQNKCVPEKSGCNCKHVNGTAQCYAFALWCENKLYGYNDVSNPSKFKSLGSVAAGSLTASKIKELITAAPLGAHIRTNGSQHSMVLMSKTSKGFTVAQANGSNNNEYSSWSACRIGTATYTWQSYVSSTYGKRGIAFIKVQKDAQTVTVPAKPVISSASLTGDNEITVKWKSVSGAEKYILQGKKSGGSYETIAEITGTSYTHKGLKASSLYWYRVKAKNSAGSSSYSDANGAYTKPATPKTSIVGTTSIEVKWSKSGGNTTYELLARKCGDDEYKTIAKNLTVCTYTHTGLQPGNQYYYKVKAHNTDNTSVVSKRSDCGYGYTKLSAPKITQKTATTVSLSWTRGSLDGKYTYTYRVRRMASSESDYTNIAVVSKYTYTDSNLKPNTTYRYYIDVLRDGKYCVRSESVDVKTNAQLATKVTLNTSKVNLALGQTQQLTATITPTNTTNKAVTWTSSNSNVAEVNNGIITAKSVGTATITVKTSNGLTASCTVDVGCVHSFGNWVTISEATCTKTGLKQHTCTSCGKVETEAVPTVAHNYSSMWTIDSMPTCEEAGSKAHYCINCDAKTDVTEIAATGHTYSGWTITKEAICGETGSRERTCLVCEKVETEVIYATEHDYSDEWTIDVEATCEESGSKSHHCTNCDAKTDVTEIAATGHNYSDWITTKEAVCGEEGSKKRTCLNCGKVETEVIYATEHDYSDEWTIDVEATCEESGSKSHHCTNCDAKTDVTEIAATGHNYSDWITTKEAVCGEEGSKKRTCLNCGKVETLTISATEHKYSNEWSMTKEATCTEDGLLERACVICGEVETSTIPSTGHKYSNKWTTDVEATCEEAGSMSRHCVKCDEKTDVTKIAATGHSYDDWTTTKEATCTSKGTMERVCLICDNTETKTIKALGHNYSSKWTVDKKATCTKAGSKSHHCTRCSAKSSITTINATGHSYKTTTTTKATTSKNGTKTTKCTVCGNVKSKTTIAKIKSVTLSSTSYTYNDNVKKPTVTVKDSNGNKLKSGTDYTVKYSSGRKNVGKYTVTVTFKGKYSGTKKLTFKINPKGTSISKLTAGKKQFTVSIKKQATQTTGYQVQYSTSSKMSNATTKTYASTSKTSRTISGLKSAKTYYVRVRTYKNVNIDGKTTKFYSSWSSVKSVKTK